MSFAAEPRCDCAARPGSETELAQDEVGAEGGYQPPEGDVLRSPRLPDQMAEPGEKQSDSQPDSPFHEVLWFVHVNLPSCGLRPCNYSMTPYRRVGGRAPTDNHPRPTRGAL